MMPKPARIEAEGARSGTKAEDAERGREAEEQMEYVRATASLGTK
jgi:hypothetical protein